MSVIEVSTAQRALAPYAMVGMIETTWPDGRISIGTCALVGSNDVLTAGHCVYDPTRGGFASGFRFYFGADYNSTRNLLEATGLSVSAGYPMSIVYSPDIYTDNDPETFWRYESQHDVALIGLSTEIRGIGILPLDFGQDRTNIQATEVGYPTGTTGMMAGPVVVDRDRIDGVYVSDAPAMGAGSSGGPLLANGSIIGVKSAGADNGSTWADVGFSETLLRTAMASNDNLLTGSGSTQDEILVGSINNDRIVAGGGDDTLDGGAGNDTLDGGAGADLARYTGLRSRFDISISTGDGSLTISDRQRTLGTDSLTQIEKLVFSDVWVSTDIRGSSAQAYRIYKAAFDRTPDLEGVGYWIAQMERGMNVVEVSARFIDSAEFRSLYGASVSNADFLTRVYNNVLDRHPDSAGLAWWVNEMQTNTSKTWQKVLADFSESPENQANVATLIAGGISYLPYDLG